MANPLDRRQWPRASHLACSAIAAQRSSYEGVFVVENLSAGGALLIGAHRYAVGDYLNLVLQFGTALKVGVSAKVIRIELEPKGKSLLGVEFQEVPGTLRQALNDIVCATLEPERNAEVTLLVQAGQAGKELERDLAALNRKVVVLANLEKAGRWLDRRPHPVVAAVIVDIASSESAAILELARSEAPAARRIALTEGTAPSPALDAMMGRGAVQAVLRRGWNLLTLAEAVLASPVIEDLKSTRAASPSLLS